MRRISLLAAAILAVPLAAQTDVWQIPLRGAVEYQRTTNQWTCSPLGDDARAGRHLLVRRGEQGGAEWRFRMAGSTGSDGFERPEYDDSGYSVGISPFGDNGQRTPWPGNQPFLEARCHFTLPRKLPRALVIAIDHDDLAQVWINGVPSYTGDRYLRGVFAAAPSAAVDSLRPGENLIVVRIHNTGGASFFDLALTGFDKTFRDPAQAVNLTRALDDAAVRIRNGLFPNFRSGPFLFEGQLDPTHRRMTDPGIDFRDLPAFLGFDLERVNGSGSQNGEAARIYRFGDVSWRGKVQPVDATGLQTMEFDVDTGEPAQRNDDKRFVERNVRSNLVWSHAFKGRIVVERRFDPTRGVVAAMHTRIEGRVNALAGDDAARPSEFVLDEEWTCRRVRPNRDPDFETQVSKAIQQGATKLKAELGDLDRPVLRNEPTANETYNSGRLALATLALIHAEVPHDDPVLSRAVAELRRRRFNDTYSTANAIMAMEAWYSPRGEREELRSGLIDRPRQRQIAAEDKKLIQDWVATLMSDIDTRVDTGYLLRFNYTGGPRYDHSVNQYGLLGLYSAMLCGIDVPGSVWTSAANHLIADQEKPGREIKLELTSYAQLERMRSGGTTSGPRPANVAGWSYQGPKGDGVPNPIYGSMTCAGLAGVTICLAGMRDAGIKRGDLEVAGERSLQRGFAWLAANFTLFSNAQRVHQPYYWVYYYLYGLERACELANVALINGRDWYFEGALTLIAQQQADGGWPDDHHPDEIMERTAMAVLFLKKSSAPVYTQK